MIFWAARRRSGKTVTTELILRFNKEIIVEQEPKPKAGEIGSTLYWARVPKCGEWDPVDRSKRKAHPKAETREILYGSGVSASSAKYALMEQIFIHLDEMVQQRSTEALKLLSRLEETK